MPNFCFSSDQGNLYEIPYSVIFNLHIIYFQQMWDSGKLNYCYIDEFYKV